MATNTDIITGLYKAFFLRAPDTSGYDYWLSQANNIGTTEALQEILQQIAKGFLAHPYAQYNLHYAPEGAGGLSDDAFVKAIYANVLAGTGQTEPAQDDVNYWTGQLTNGASRSSMVLQFVTDSLDYNGADSQGALRKQALLNSITVADAWRTLGNATNITDSDQLASDLAFQASQRIISGVTSDSSTATAATAFIQTHTPDPIQAINSASDSDIFGSDTVAPVVVAGQVFSYAENQTAGVLPGITVNATDHDGVTAFRIDPASDPSHYFTIDDKGSITLTEAGAAAAVNNFEATPNTFAIGIVAIDAAGHESRTADVILKVTDVADTNTVTLSQNPVTVDEGSSVTYTVTLGAAAQADGLSIPVALTGTATSGVDYTGNATSINVAAGDTTGTLTLAVAADATTEGPETIIPILGALPIGYVLANPGAGTVTTTVNDTSIAPTGTTVTLTGATSVNEGSSVTYTVTLGAAAPADGLSIPVALTGTATSGVDYTGNATSINVAAGDTTGTLTLAVAADATTEGPETIVAALGTLPTGYGLSGTGTVTTTVNDTSISGGTDTTPPHLKAVALSGTKITLTYDEPLKAGHIPGSLFFVSYYGGNTTPIDAYTDGSQVIVILGLLTAGNPQVSYLKPSTLDAPQVKDIAGNPASSFQYTIATRGPLSSIATSPSDATGDTGNLLTLGVTDTAMTHANDFVFAGV